MLYYNKTDVTKGIDFNKTTVSKKCIICCYRYFSDKGFKFQSNVCKGCHDILMMSAVDITNLTIFNINGVDYCCIIFNIAGLLLSIIDY